MENKSEKSSAPIEKSNFRNSQIEWLEDSTMVTEIEKLSDELKNRKLSVGKAESENFISSQEPLIKSDYRSEIKDGVKEFEINGKKYLRKYQRKINLQKHSVKQLFTFCADEDSILDIDIVPEINQYQGTLIDDSNDVFYTINTKILSDECRNSLSPKIVIRSLRSQGQHSPTNSGSLAQSASLTEDNFEFDSSSCSTSTDKDLSISSKFVDFNSKTSSLSQEVLSESLYSIDRKLSTNLRNSFLAQWQKSESSTVNNECNNNNEDIVIGSSASTSPQGKSKTISCLERFNTISSQGSVLYGSTCVQLTRSLLVRPSSLSEPLKEECEEQKEAKISKTNEEPLLYKADVTNYLVYNEQYDPKSDNICKHISVSAGELDAIIAHACSIGLHTTPDYHLFHKVFVVTYRLFINTRELLEKLFKRYKYFGENPKYNTHHLIQEFQDELSSENKDNIKEALQTAIINLLIEIIKQWNRPIEDDVYHDIQSFCDYLTSTGGIKKTLLLNSALRDLNNRITLQESRLSTLKEYKLSLLTKAPSEGISNRKTFMNFDSQIMAEQITLLESEVFDRIQLEDLLNFKSAVHNSNLMNCVHFFNNITFWTKTLLFSDKSSVEREKKFVKFLEIMKILKSHQNYSSYTSILFSLIDFPDKLLSKKTRQKLSEESEFMVSFNKHQYFEAIQSAEPPFIPLLADTFSHLTRINEIMRTFIPASAKSINKSLPLSSSSASTQHFVNYKKMWNYFIIIQFFIKKTQLPFDKRYYQFTPDYEVLSFINNFSDCYTEAELFVCRDNLIRSKSKKHHHHHHHNHQQHQQQQQDSQNHTTDNQLTNTNTKIIPILSANKTFPTTSVTKSAPTETNSTQIQYF